MVAMHCGDCGKALAPDIHGEPLRCPCGSRQPCTRQRACPACVRLKRLHNRGTRYEVVATLGERCLLVGYARNRSQRALRDTMRAKGPALVELTGAEEFKVVVTGLRLGEWLIGFSGRTQRDAIGEGERESL